MQCGQKSAFSISWGGSGLDQGEREAAGSSLRKNAASFNPCRLGTRPPPTTPEPLFQCVTWGCSFTGHWEDRIQTQEQQRSNSRHQLTGHVHVLARDRVHSETRKACSGDCRQACLRQDSCPVGFNGKLSIILCVFAFIAGFSVCVCLCACLCVFRHVGCVGVRLCVRVQSFVCPSLLLYISLFLYVSQFNSSKSGSSMGDNKQ